MAKFLPKIALPKWMGTSYDLVSVWRNVDVVLLIAVFLQSVIGTLTVYSATRQRLINQGFDQYVYVQRQVLFVIVGAVITFIVMAVGHDWIRERAVFWFISTSLLLVLVLVYGAVTRGARLAFDLGPISLQPAELMKVAVLILIAAYTADAAYDKIDYHQFSVSLLILGFPVLLILLQPDLGSATVVVAGVAGVLLMAGAKRRYIALISGLTIVSAVAVALAGVVDRYQLRRIDAFLNQDSTEKDLQQIVLQVRFAKRAVASGGFFGKGYLQGPLTNGAFIPVQFSDFPFSAIGEQFGMIGGFVVLAIFGVILWRLWMISRLARTRFDQLLISGVFSLMLFQIFQNIGMTLGLTPVSGLPLPFISYGGSHLVSSAMMVGLAQSIYMRRLR
ncbi:MAG: FtsW/RodA/SpoVE family cell cycle protein [Ilumatobacteraceae bacterium]|nr:FtsW/RodA/SpoVE family cell cycle protein [Ilumatobacteraceae bacterium]MBJ7421879.1 FtsW/RodA/SpoVE family cell cycle protein [Ilumatobacteraceae bacterium]